MKNEKITLDNVLEVLEGKGYTVEYDDTVTVLEIESPTGAYMDITPIFMIDGIPQPTYIIPDFVDTDTRNICFEFYGYSLDYPTASELISEIEDTFK